MQVVLLVIQLLIAVALIGCILIQRTAQDGGGLMGGGSTMGGLFTARGSANLLTRTTAILATCFLLNCLLLAFIASHEHGSNRSPLDQLGAAATSPTTGQNGEQPAGDASEQEEQAPVPSTPVSTALPSGANGGAEKSAKPSAKGVKSDGAPHGKKDSSPPQVPVAK